MSRIVFRHADKDLVFTVSPLDWDAQLIAAGEVKQFQFPIPSSDDVGKFLMIGPDGQAHYTAVKPGAVDFNVENFKITGNLGNPAANINAMPTPLVVHPSQLVILSDRESGGSYVWTGGTGMYGQAAGGAPVTNEMMAEIKGGDVDVAFATPVEVQEAREPEKAINPVNAEHLDVDGGTF